MVAPSFEDGVDAPGMAGGGVHHLLSRPGDDAERNVHSIPSEGFRQSGWMAAVSECPDLCHRAGGWVGSDLYDE